jgi:hypothetical protein
MSKHECDGHARAFTEEGEVRIGVVVRRYQSDGGLSTFSDTVIVGITYGEEFRRKHFSDLTSAYTAYCEEMRLGLAVNRKDTAYRGIQIHLARPYLYADSIGTSINHLTGVEKHSTSAARLLDEYNLIEMSTGKPATSNVREM